MFDKLPTEWEPENWAIAFLIAIVGGIVNWSNRIKKGYIHTFSLFELMGEMTTSGFVGVVSVMSVSSIPNNSIPPLTYFAVAGICGHFGTRLLFFVQILGQTLFDKYITKINPNAKIYDMDVVQDAFSLIARHYQLNAEQLKALRLQLEQKPAPENATSQSVDKLEKIPALPENEQTTLLDK